jgi:large subunit ribosomal protein L17
MRHGNKLNHLGRKSAHRKALLSNLASSLIEHKHIVTTTAKAKALRIYIEPLITKAKDNTTHSRRVVFSYLNSKEAVSALFSEVAEKVATRAGGYTRIIKLEPRAGDAAEMALIELVDFSLLNGGKTEAQKAAEATPGRKRTRRGSNKNTPSNTNIDTTKPKADHKKSAPRPGGANAPKVRQRRSGDA